MYVITSTSKMYTQFIRHAGLDVEEEIMPSLVVGTDNLNVLMDLCHGSLTMHFSTSTQLLLNSVTVSSIKVNRPCN